MTYIRALDIEVLSESEVLAVAESLLNVLNLIRSMHGLRPISLAQVPAFIEQLANSKKAPARSPGFTPAERDRALKGSGA